MHRTVLIPLAIASIGGAARAQWSSNPAVNLAIADRPNEQVQPKVRVTSDGGCYVSWFDNAAGGYDVYLQRLNAAGVEQWAHNGLLIANRSFSSTQDYGLAVDASDRAVITYRDDRTGSVQIGVNLVSAAGTLTWGPNGVLVTNTTDSVASPRVCVTSDGFYAVAWSQGNNLAVQKLDAGGVPQWPAPAVVPPAGGFYLITDVIASDAGSVIVGGVKNPERHLHAQKLSAAGAPLWGASPVVVFNGSSLQFGDFPTFLPDAVGGAVFGWYETGGSRNVYVQRVLANGAEHYAHNGVAVSTLAGRIRLTPSIAYDETTGDIFAFWTETNSVQSMWGVYGQKVAVTGARTWGDSARELIPLTTSQNAFVRAVRNGSGAMVFCFDRSGPAQVLAMAVDAAGNFTWPGQPRVACSVLSNKFRLDAAITPTGNARIVWGDARADAGNVFAQNINPDGSLGPGGCYPDCNADGALTVADFGCFQTKFVAADPYADCNGDGQRTVADFGCFQTKFVAGCP